MNNDRRKRLNTIIAGLSALRDQLDEIRDEEQEAYNNMPESLQQADRGEITSNGLDELSSASDELETIIDNIQDVMET